MMHPHTGEEYEDTTFGRLVEGDYFRGQTPKGEPCSLWIKVSENLKDNARPANRTKNPEEPLRTFQDADPVFRFLYAPDYGQAQSFERETAIWRLRLR